MREGQQLALFCQLLRRLAAATLAARETPAGAARGYGEGSCDDGAVVMAEAIELAMAAARREVRAEAGGVDRPSDGPAHADSELTVTGTPTVNPTVRI